MTTIFRSVFNGNLKILILGLGIVEMIAAQGGATMVTTNSSNEVTYDVPTGETYVENDAFSSEIAKVTKIGGGTLQLTASQSDFISRTLEISAGYVKTAQSSKPIGTSTVKVFKGGALWYTGTNPGQTTHIFPSVEIAGNGPDGNGAFYRSSKAGGDQIIGKLKLTDGATVGGNRRYGVLELDLDGFTLTNALEATSDNPLMFLNATVKNPGNIVQKSAYVTCQGVKEWGSPSEDSSSWTMAKDGAVLHFYTSPVEFPWHIVAEQNFTLAASSAHPVLTGPIELHGKVLTFGVGSSSVVSTRRFKVKKSVSGGSIMLNSPYVDVSFEDSSHSLSSVIGSSGSLTITGGVRQVLATPWNDVSMMNGSALKLIDAGMLCTTTAQAYVYNAMFASRRQPSRIDVTGKTTWTQLEDSSFTIVQIGGKRDDETGGTGWGVMSVSGGAVVTNGLAIGPKGRGALYVKEGASVCSRSGFWLDIGGDKAAGTYRYGFLGVDDSLFGIRGGCRVAVAPEAEGHVVLHGGTFDFGNSSLNLSAGTANFYADGTTFTRSTDSVVVTLGDRNSLTGGSGVFTLDNGATLKSTRLVHKAHTNYLAQVNVNNGAKLGVYQTWASDVSSSQGPAAKGARSIFSFDGGILDYYSPQQGSQKLFTSNPDVAFVHAGGLTVNVATQTTLCVDMPLTRPAGRSFKSISKPTDATFLAKSFIGPVQLVFEGTGEGASAFIDFDTATETLGNVVITSKGSGYDETTKVYAVPHESPTERYECSYVLLEESGGDLTKTGDGTLCLDCTNTYGGATIVNGGSLYARVNYALPSNTAVRVNNGSILNLFNREAKLSSIGGSGGFINGAKDSGALTIDAFDVADAGKIVFNGVSKLIVTGTMNVDCAELVANQARGRSLELNVNVEFAPTAKIAFSNVAVLDNAVNRYPILAVSAGKTMTGAPEIIHGEVLGGHWAYRSQNKILELRRRYGLMLMVR